MTSLIQNTAATIKNGLYECLEQFSPDIVIAENALTLPMNIPLGMALDQLKNLLTGPGNSTGGPNASSGSARP